MWVKHNETKDVHVWNVESLGILTSTAKSLLYMEKSLNNMHFVFQRLKSNLTQLVLINLFILALAKYL